MPKRKLEKLEQCRLAKLRKKLTKLETLLGTVSSESSHSEQSDEQFDQSEFETHSDSSVSVQSTDVPQQPTTPPRLPKELDLHPEFVSLLGVDPNTANSQDTSLNEHLVKRWSSYASLNYKAREQLKNANTVQRRFFLLISWLKNQMAQIGLF
ncbi:uncharacterized protein LOC135135652 [Zophobas morio]|uniref:uncharacterized protein LOC135135652 n=1 Tax=Zophobas morio TaxID=2755281 RepID=UPI0030836036